MTTIYEAIDTIINILNLLVHYLTLGLSDKLNNFFIQYPFLTPLLKTRSGAIIWILISYYLIFPLIIAVLLGIFDLCFGNSLPRVRNRDNMIVFSYSFLQLKARSRIADIKPGKTINFTNNNEIRATYKTTKNHSFKSYLINPVLWIFKTYLINTKSIFD